MKCSICGCKLTEEEIAKAEQDGYEICCACFFYNGDLLDTELER